jgi:hypothetical protein
MACMLRPSGLIKVEGSTSAFKVDNVSWKHISIINPNCYQILVYLPHPFTSPNLIFVGKAMSLPLKLSPVRVGLSLACK